MMLVPAGPCSMAVQQINFPANVWRPDQAIELMNARYVPSICDLKPGTALPA